MYTATVPITITTFNPLPGSMQASVGAALNTSPQAPNSAGVFTPGPDAGSGPTIVVTRPQGYTGAVQLTFQLYSTDYILAGIAVNSKTAAKGPIASTGRTQFRTVIINRDPSGSQMIVTDALLDNATYGYLILVQAVTGPNAGQIGAIDPDIDNEGGE